MARELHYMPVETLPEAPRNPKVHSPEIGASISRFGYVEPVVLDDRTGRLVSGHGRREQLLAKKAAGEPPPEGIQVAPDGSWLVPVVRGWASANDLEAEAFLIAANQLPPLGGWDDALLASMLAEQAAGPAAFAGLGFDQTDLERLLAELAPPAVPLTDPDAIPEPPAEPVSQPGDLWLLAGHRLLCGDAREPDAMCQLMALDQADMVWTDPPYGVEYGAKNRFLQTIGPADRLEEDIAGDGADPALLRELLSGVFRNVLAATRPGAVWFVAAPAGPPLGVFAAELLAIGIWRQLLCWVKNRPIFGRSDYHYQHENLFYGWTPGAAHQPPPSHSTSSIWHYDSPAASKLHPTQKPVELVSQAIANHTAGNAVVLDPFSGSGTTLIAAEQLGRRCYAMEISPAYTDVAVRRWEQYTGQEAVRQPAP